MAQSKRKFITVDKLGKLGFERLVPSENPIRRRNSRVWPNRSKVGACVMPYDFCP
ncbi:MAG: hypothetical protein IID48_19780 [Proteobacteria bacterium]|nr:hypothetical protein [Pseudomonadota bacterium]